MKTAEERLSERREEHAFYTTVEARLFENREEHAFCTTVEERPFRAAFIAQSRWAFRPGPSSCEPTNTHSYYGNRRAILYPTLLT